MDNGKVTALTLLDLYFDTIDHATLLVRLHGYFGISGTVLQWFKSYISNRQQRVHIDGSLSCPQSLKTDDDPCMSPALGNMITDFVLLRF